MRPYARLFSLVAVLSTAPASTPLDIPPTKEGQPEGVGRAAEPYKVHSDVRPKILLGPYIVAPSDTSATVVWVHRPPRPFQGDPRGR